MRKTKELFSNDKKLIIQEMTPREILNIFNSWKDDIGKKDLEQQFSWSEIPIKFVPALIGIPYDNLLDYTGSEIEQIIITFKEVNASFFKIPDLLAFLNIKDLVEGFIHQMKTDMLARAQSNSPANYQDSPGIITENKPNILSKSENANVTTDLPTN